MTAPKKCATRTWVDYAIINQCKEPITNDNYDRMFAHACFHGCTHNLRTLSLMDPVRFFTITIPSRDFAQKLPFCAPASMQWFYKEGIATRAYLGEYLEDYIRVAAAIYQSFRRDSILALRLVQATREEMKKASEDFQWNEYYKCTPQEREFFVFIKSLGL